MSSLQHTLETITYSLNHHIVERWDHEPLESGVQNQQILSLDHKTGVKEKVACTALCFMRLQSTRAMSWPRGLGSYGREDFSVSYEHGKLYISGMVCLC